MSDITVMVVKPEIIERQSEVATSLNRRGYTSVHEEQREGWREFMRQIYEQQLSKKLMAAYVSAYMNWSNTFGLFVLSHNGGNTLFRLKAEQGHFREYQDKDDGSLRSEFGLPALWNKPHSEDFTFVFNGLHCPGTHKDLEGHLRILRLMNFV